MTYRKNNEKNRPAEQKRKGAGAFFKNAPAPFAGIPAVLGEKSGRFPHNRGNNGPEITCQLLWGLLEMIADPPLYHIDKTAGNIIDQKVPRYRGQGGKLRLGDPLAEQLIEICFEILQKEVPTFTGKDADDIFLAVPQVIEDVRYDLYGRTAG